MKPFQELEIRWAEFNQLPPEGMVACSSGTAALHLSLEALRLPLGSEVIVPDYTMIACPRAITLAGLTPVFVDCGLGLLMDLELAAWKSQSGLVGTWKDDEGEVHTYHGIKVVMAVHVYGRQCNMDELHDIEYKYEGQMVRPLVIEDLAEAHGVRPHPLTDAACWSFYRNKIVAGEEGGAVWFRDPEHAVLARSLRSLGFTEAHDFTHRPRGHNYRMSNVHAELVLKSLGHYGSNLLRRRDAVKLLDRACPKEWRMPPRNAPWVYDVRVGGMTAEIQVEVVKALQAAGIAARHGFKPCSSQEEFRSCRLIKGKEHLATRLAREVIYLPLAPGSMDGGKVEAAFRIIRETLESLSGR